MKILSKIAAWFRRPTVVNNYVTVSVTSKQEPTRIARIVSEKLAKAARYPRPS